LPDNGQPAPLLEVSDLTVVYGGAPRPAVEGADLVLERAGSLGLAGESGSGKSTLAHAVLGLLPATARRTGTVRFAGAELASGSAAYRTLRWKRMSVVLQDAMNAFNPVVTMGEQIAEIWTTHQRTGWREALEKAQGLVQRVGLESSAVDRFPFELSGGMRQRAAIAMAVALSPDLVVVDEPTSALDVLSANTVVDVINAAREETGAAFLVISHDISVIARTCARACVLREGRVVEEGETPKLLEAPEHEVTRRLILAIPRLPLAETGGAS